MTKEHSKTRKLLAACFLLLCVTVLSGAGYAEENTRAEITVTAFGATYTYRDDILPAPDHTVYEQIERRNINADLKEKIKTVDKCIAAGAEWREAMRYAFPRLPAFVENVCAASRVQPYDSEIFFSPSARPMFRITREREGREADEKRLYQDIYWALRKESKVAVAAHAVRLLPAVTAKDNILLTKKTATFSTSFASSAEGRKNNIRLALRKVSGTVLMPHEEFSFNECVGPRTEQSGFSTAKIIVGGQYVEGLGGGVCQASTTLYNAALRAGMRITAVRNHSILPSYVPPSLDAMVSGSAGDLRFVNPFDTPVFIAAATTGDTASVTFYGAKLPYVIRPVSRVLSRTPAPQDKEITDEKREHVAPDAESGTRVRVSYGHEGVRSEAYLRYFTPAGVFVREEKIRSDVYTEVAGVIAVAP